MIDYTIISSGSSGNAVIINNYILIDCGVSFASIKPYYKDIKLVLITHGHGDHFKKNTISRLIYKRPALRFSCGAFLKEKLTDCGVIPDNIDVLNSDITYNYKAFTVTPVTLTHDVPCYGYKINFNGEKLFYATDTYSLNGITAKDYDLYMVEANYEDEELQERISQKKAQGIFAHEIKSQYNHLSKLKADEFIYRNIGTKGQYIYMHQHEEASHDHDCGNNGV